MKTATPEQRRQFCDRTMRNFDYTIPEDMARLLQQNPTFQAAHQAQDYRGVVYWRDGLFHEDVFLKNENGEMTESAGTVSEPTLNKLMLTVNRRFGWD